jgi:hypothetical protein
VEERKRVTRDERPDVDEQGKTAVGGKKKTTKALAV